MEIRSIIKKEPAINRGYNKYIVVVMGLIGLLVGGFFVAKFLVNVFK